jgi:ATP-dependent helicase HrpB
MANLASNILQKLASFDLPIVNVIDELQQQFVQNNNIILQASPGAGKTSTVPLVLLQQLKNNQKILLLQPRRIAAKNAALRLAEILQEKVGQTVGYRIRHQSKVSSATKIEVITEGILIRMLQSDPELSDIGLIIFDEFHERNLDSDLGLAFSLEVQQTLRDDLKLMIMSATLDLKNLSELLSNAPLITCEGRSFPIEIDYFSSPLSGSQRLSGWKNELVSAVQSAINNSASQAKNVLVFLAGIAEINWAEKQLQPLVESNSDYQLVKFYGDLPFEQQQKIISSDNNEAKIILSTNIAETSVTIMGIGTVIDSGLKRENYFDPNVGFNRLRTVRISQAAATQRAGRAGRLSAGRCIRLWSESETLREQSIPDILREDLTSVSLELAAWGIQDVSQLSLLDLPNQGALQQARNLLVELNALDTEYKITQHGSKIHSLLTHPRLANMLIRSLELNCEKLACLTAALLEDKDIFVGEARKDTDFSARISFVIEQSINHGSNWACKQILARASKLYTKLKSVSQPQQTKNTLAKKALQIDSKIYSELDFVGVLTAIAFPDRIAIKRGQGYRLANGTGAMVDTPLPSDSELLVAVVLGGQGKTAKIFQMTDLSLAELESHFSSLIVDKEVTQWDQKTQSVKAYTERRFAALTLSKRSIAKPNKQLVLNGLLEGVKQHGLPWSDELRQLQARVLRLRSLPGFKQDFPDFSDEFLLQTIDTWLAPYLNGMNKLSQISSPLFSKAIEGLLDWSRLKQLDDLMPERIKVASGSSIKIDYLSSNKPILAVKLQEMFGEKESPKIAKGKVSLLIHLLSPAGRPLAITEDLASFWANGYVEVKKQMKGKYPKHPWPDDPLTAVATRYTKKRR